MAATFTSQVTYSPTRPEGTVVLVSSGVDSTICGDMYPAATRLFVDFGQAELAREYSAVEALFPDIEVAHIVARIAHTGDGVFVPARNLLLACVAVQYGDHIVMGGMKDDRSIDKTPAAFQAMSRILSDQSGYPVTVESPLFDLLKHEAVGQYIAQGTTPNGQQERRDRMRRTWSCYGAEDQPCLRCKACFRWAVALRVNAIPVPMPQQDIVTGYLGRLHIYEPGRQWAILTALRLWHDDRHAGARPVAMVDIDGVLTTDTAGQDYVARQPDLAALARLAELAETHWVVLNTARDESDRTVTEAWLRTCGGPHHALLMNKAAGNVLVDDRSVRRLADV